MLVLKGNKKLCLADNVVGVAHAIQVALDSE